MARDDRHSGVKRSPNFRSYQQGTMSLIGMMAIVALETGKTPPIAALLANWRFDSVANQLEFTLENSTTPRYFLLGEPPRLVIDLPNTQLGKVASQQTYSGVVREVRVSQFEKDIARIVIELSPEVVLAPGQMQLQRITPADTKENRWLLRPGIVGQITPLQASQIPPSTPTPTTEPAAVTSVTPTTLPATIVPPANVKEPPAVTSVTPPNLPPSTALPPANLGNGQSAMISVPPLAASPVNPQELEPTSPVVVPATNQSNNILLPVGTRLSLRYAGNNLTLQPGSPQSVELLLQDDLRAIAGDIIAPSGSRVLGRFETDSKGSRYITQAIAIPGRNLPLAATSDILGSNQTSTKPPTLTPGQILQVRLIEPLRKS